MEDPGFSDVVVTLQTIPLKRGLGVNKKRSPRLRSVRLSGGVVFRVSSVIAAFSMAAACRGPEKGGDTCGGIEQEALALELEWPSFPLPPWRRHLSRNLVGRRPYSCIAGSLMIVYGMGRGLACRLK